MPKRRLIEDVGSYFSATMITQIVSLVTAVLTRRYLGPDEMGVWALLQIVLLYSAYSTLGATESVYREIPFYLGKGDEQKAGEVRDLVGTFSALTATTAAAGIFIYAVLARHSLSEPIFYGLLAASALVVLQKANNFLVTLLLGYKKFSFASRQKLFSAIANLVLVVALTPRFGFYGFLAAILLSFVSNLLFLFAIERFSFRWTFDMRKIGALIAYGFPLMATGLIGNFFLTIDKIMIAKMLGIESLGLYSLALLAYSYISGVPNAVGVVLIPNVHEKFGLREKVEDLRSFVRKSSDLYADVMPFLIAAVWFLVPFATKLLMPRFVESVEPMMALVLSAFFLALAHPYAAFLAVIRRQVYLVPVIVTACALVLALNYWMITSGFGLVGVGIATTLAVFAKYTATYFLACKKLFPWPETLKYYFISIWKFTLMTSVLALIDRFLFTDGVTAAGSFLKFALFSVLYSGTIVRIERDHGILRSLEKRFFIRVPATDKIVE